MMRKEGNNFQNYSDSHVKRIWYTEDSGGQILAVAFRSTSLQFLKLLRAQRDWDAMMRKEGKNFQTYFEGHDVKKVLDASCGTGIHLTSHAIPPTSHIIHPTSHIIDPTIHPTPTPYIPEVNTTHKCQGEVA